METTPKQFQPCRRLEFEQDHDHRNSDANDVPIESLHSNMSKDSIPREGMEFETETDAYEFYNAYAYHAGFSVRKSYKHKVDGVVVDRVFVCSSQGKRGHDKRDDVYKSHRPETRFGCFAMLKISCRHTRKYHVEKFIAEHSHILASPGKAHLFRSHRNILKAQAFQVDMAESSGIPPSNTFEFMAKLAGGRDKLGFSKVDVKNYLRSKRSVEMVSGDTGGVLEFLQNAKMVADFEDFGDVVI